MGARKFLIAYNIYLEDGADVGFARAVAKGHTGVERRPAGCEGDGRRRQWARPGEHEYHGFPPDADEQSAYCGVRYCPDHRVEIAGAEIIGLIPEQAYEPNAEWVRQIVEFDPEQKVLERRLRQPLDWPE